MGFQVTRVCLGIERSDKTTIILLENKESTMCAVRLCPGLFVCHLLWDDLSHSPPALFVVSYRSSGVSTSEQNNPNSQYIM